MGYKYSSEQPSGTLCNYVKKFFLIEFDNEDLESDYLLPDGIPSFFFLQTEKPLSASFGNESLTLSLDEGLYIGYSNVSVKLSYFRSRIIGVSIYPTHFETIIGKSPLETVNKFRRIEIPFFSNAVQLALSSSERPLSGVFMLFELYIVQQLSGKGENVDVHEVFNELMGDKGYWPRVDELAGKLGYSSRYLNIRFKQYFGVSPKQYIKLVRFNRALKYMQDLKGEKNLSYIAHETGYHDQSHFIREFKSICGKTPKEFLESDKSLAMNFRLF